MEKLAVHPLVIMNMSDHFTRAIYRQKQQVIRVMGFILGRQSGLQLEVVNSVEIKRDHQSGAIDMQFARERITAYKTMYADLEVIGWYSVD